VPAPVAAPSSLTAEQADGNILLTWPVAATSTGYVIQRTTAPDGTGFTTLATVGNQLQYVDSLPAPSTMYYYQVAGTNGSGTGPFSAIAQMAPAPPSEMSLFEMRLRSQQTADRVGSQFVINTEWNAFIRLAMYELYDLIMDTYEDYFASSFVLIQTNGTTANYALPNGTTNYLGGNYNGLAGSPASAFYKPAGVDLAINTSTVSPAYVTLVKYNFCDRNKFIYPNSTSTIYGVYNMRFRFMGNNINIIPTPSGNQTLRLWYSPRLSALLQDTDVSTLGYSGWLRYAIVRTAIYALAKEEGTDTSGLKEELLFLKNRIEQAASNRDLSMPDTISNSRIDPVNNWNNGGSGGQAGW
jgi:hypothetical protein